VCDDWFVVDRAGVNRCQWCRRHNQTRHSAHA
jgi:hypothetical protein